MKNIIIAAMLAVFVTVSWADGETKKVCVDAKDRDGKVLKDNRGNAKQVCKDVKQHKKLDGTKVPEKSK